MTVFKAGILLALDLCPSKKCPNECLDLIDLDDSYLVGVDCVENILGHLSELLAIDEDVRQVLNRYFVVDEDISILVDLGAISLSFLV